MKDLYSKCGTNCARCPSYKENLLSEEDRQNCSEGWYTYHGFRISPEKLIACDGCQPIGENGNGTRYINCIVRRCALHNEVDTCAHCSVYPCDVLISRVLGKEWEDRLVERLGEIPEDDYRVFVEPYVVMPHLEDIRATLDPGDIKAIKEFTIKPRLAAFPSGLESAEVYKNLYRLLEKVDAPVDGLSYAQAEIQKERRTHILKILWAFGLFGKFNDAEKGLLLDHKTYLKQKIHSNYDRILGYFEILAGFGVHCQVVPLIEENWLTPTRSLRRQGSREASPPWVMEMTIDERIGGVELINALQRYARDLDKAFGKKAYTRFRRSDMQIMNRG